MPAPLGLAVFSLPGRVALPYLLVLAISPWGEVAGFQRSNLARVNVQIRLPVGMVEAPDVMRVVLSTIDGGFVMAKTLHAETNVRLDRVRQGQYILSVESPGYQSGSQWIDINAPYSNFEMMVILTLGPRTDGDLAEGVPPPGGQETVSVAALNLPAETLKELQKGEKEAQRSNTRKAIEHFEKATRLCPDCYQGFEALGMQYASLQLWSEAIQALEKSAELFPENPRGRRNLAQLYLTQARYETAVEHLNQASILEEQNSRTLRLLGEAYLGLSEWETALDYFLTASQLNPEDHSHLGIGQCYLELGRTTEALLELREFVERNPQDLRAESVRQFLKQWEKDGGRQQ